MGNFRRDNRGDSRDRRSSMHKATCSECGKSCEVPFKPTGSKPVFCSSCFEKQDSQPRRFDSKKPRHFDRGDKQMFKATCSECGKSCEVPFKPTGSKPVFCSECFETSGGGSRSSSSNKQLETITEKLDQILNLLGNSDKMTEEKKTVENKVTVTAKAKKKAPVKSKPKKKAVAKKKVTKKKK